MTTTPQPVGWIIVNGNTDSLDWDTQLYPSREHAIQGLIGNFGGYCRDGEDTEDKRPWSDDYQILPVYRDAWRRPAAEHVEGEQAGPSDAEVEAAARAAREHWSMTACTGDDTVVWSSVSRAALVAARTAAEQ